MIHRHRWAARLALFSAGAVCGGILTLTLYLALVGGAAPRTSAISAPPLALPPPRAAATGSASTPTTMPDAEPPAPAEDQRVLFRIVPAQSSASFSVLHNGTPLIGTTDQVAGDVIVDPTTPQNVQLGTVRVNLRALRTDNQQRDAVIRATILRSGRAAYEFGTFVPTAIRNVPSQARAGAPIAFQIAGELTLRGVTQPTLFDATVTVNDRTQLTGRAVTVVSRTAYGIAGLPTVGDAVTITLEFSATAVAGAM